MSRHDDLDVILLAARVLSQVESGEAPSRRAVIILRRKARPDVADLPVAELCRHFLQHEPDDSRKLAGEVTSRERDAPNLKILAAKACYLAQQCSARCISDDEYLERLNALRHEHGLEPISDPTLATQGDRDGF